MLCCVCYRNPATIFNGRAGYCGQCADPKPFVEKSAKADAEDAAAQAALEEYRAKQRKKKGHKNGPAS